MTFPRGLVEGTEAPEQAPSTTTDWGSFYSQGSMPTAPSVPNAPTIDTTTRSLPGPPEPSPYEGGGENVYAGGQNLNVDPLEDFIAGLRILSGGASQPIPFGQTSGYSFFDDARQSGLNPPLSQTTTNWGGFYNIWNGGDVPIITDQPRGAESQFIGDRFYSGGSEQATLGVFHQQLANLGMLTDTELGFLGLTPTNQMSWVLSPADTRRLTSDDPALSAYADELRSLYGDDWFEQLYYVDPDTGWAFLQDWTVPDDGAGGWSGYGGGGGGGRYGGYGGTYQAAARNGLINWRISIS